MLIDTHNICCFNCAKGLRNDLKAAMDKIDQQYLNEIVGGTESGELDTQHDLKVHEENTTIEELEVQCNVQEKRMNLQLLNSFSFCQINFRTQFVLFSIILCLWVVFLC